MVPLSKQVMRPSGLTAHASDCSDAPVISVAQTKLDCGALCARASSASRFAGRCRCSASSACCWYVTEEQRPQAGWIGREGDRLCHSRAPRQVGTIVQARAGLPLCQLLAIELLGIGEDRPSNLPAPTDTDSDTKKTLAPEAGVFAFCDFKTSSCTNTFFERAPCTHNSARMRRSAASGARRAAP